MLILIGEILIFLGTIFMFLAAIGVYRMPDYLMKLQVASKASAFGVLLMLVGGNLIIQRGYFFLSSLLIITFLLITNPIGAHILANTAKGLDQ